MSEVQPAQRPRAWAVLHKRGSDIWKLLEDKRSADYWATQGFPVEPLYAGARAESASANTIDWFDECSKQAGKAFRFWEALEVVKGHLDAMGALKGWRLEAMRKSVSDALNTSSRIPAVIVSDEFQTLMVAEAHEQYPQSPGSHRTAFIAGAKWGHAQLQSQSETADKYVHLDDVVYHLDDIAVDMDSKCYWADVANALTHIRMCAAGRLSQPASAWQPIETAPRDGTPIEVCNSRLPSLPPVIVRWLDEFSNPDTGWCDAATAAGDALYFNKNYFDFWKPTSAVPSAVREGDKQ